MIDLTQSQCKNMAEFIEYNIFNDIRKNDDIDNMNWLVDMVEAYKKLVEGCTPSLEIPEIPKEERGCSNCKHRSAEKTCELASVCITGKTADGSWSAPSHWKAKEEVTE